MEDMAKRVEDVSNAMNKYLKVITETVQKFIKACGYSPEEDSEITHVQNIPKPPKVIGRPLQGHRRVMFIRKLC